MKCVVKQTNIVLKCKTWFLVSIVAMQQYFSTSVYFSITKASYGKVKKSSANFS